MGLNYYCFVLFLLLVSLCIAEWSESAWIEEGQRDSTSSES